MPSLPYLLARYGLAPAQTELFGQSIDNNSIPKAMQKGTCKYYTGNYHNTHCAAGVAYDSVTTELDKPFGKAYRKPCIAWDEKRWGLSKEQAAEYARRGTCEKREEPTVAEIRAFEKEMEEHASRFDKLTPLLARIKTEQRGKSWQGIEVCPVCGNKLHISIAAYNGHTRGRCETEACLAWIE